MHWNTWGNIWMFAVFPISNSLQHVDFSMSEFQFRSAYWCSVRVLDQEEINTSPKVRKEHSKSTQLLQCLHYEGNSLDKEQQLGTLGSRGRDKNKQPWCSPRAGAAWGIGKATLLVDLETNPSAPILILICKRCKGKKSNASLHLLHIYLQKKYNFNKKQNNNPCGASETAARLHCAVEQQKDEHILPQFGLQVNLASTHQHTCRQQQPLTLITSSSSSSLQEWSGNNYLNQSLFKKTLCWNLWRGDSLIQRWEFYGVFLKKRWFQNFKNKSESFPFINKWFSSSFLFM